MNKNKYIEVLEEALIDVLDGNADPYEEKTQHIAR